MSSAEDEERVSAAIRSQPTGQEAPPPRINVPADSERTHTGQFKKQPPKKDRAKADHAEYARNRRHRVKRIAGSEIRYDSVEHIPPIEIDYSGQAKRPPTPQDAYIKDFTIEERKVRFLLMWNYSAGNKTLACQDAGIPRELADEWMRDPLFIKYIERAKEEIADRLMLRLAQRVGLMPLPEGIRIHDAALFGLVKQYKPDAFGDLADPGVEDEKPKADSNIPRPQRDV